MKSVRTTRVFTKAGNDTIAYLLVEPLNRVSFTIDTEATRYEGHIVNGYDLSGNRYVADGAFVLASGPMGFDDAFAFSKELSDLVEDSSKNGE